MLRLSENEMNIMMFISGQTVAEHALFNERICKYGDVEVVAGWDGGFGCDK